MTHSFFQQELIEACRKGDPKAQLQVYKSNYRQMFNISYNLVGNTVTADEIVKESFMIVFEKVNAFRGLADFTIWLKGVVEDRSVETWRRVNISEPGLVTDRALVK